MTIVKIDSDLCDGCGLCINTCQIDVIRMDEKERKAVIMYPEDCVLCFLCERDCPQHAISVLPANHIPELTLWGI